VHEDISPQCIGITDGRSNPIRRAVNAATATIQDVRVDHCRAHVFVTQEFLNCPNIATIFKQVGCERMTQGVIILLTNSLPRRFITDITPFMEQKSK